MYLYDLNVKTKLCRFQVFDHLLVFIEDLIGNYGHNKFQASVVHLQKLALHQSFSKCV